VRQASIGESSVINVRGPRVHHQPKAQLSTSWQADYPIFGALCGPKSDILTCPGSADIVAKVFLHW
jgi:hypothetical protein